MSIAVVIWREVKANLIQCRYSSEDALPHRMAIDVKTVMDTVESYIADVRKTFPVHKVYLYGSYAKEILKTGRVLYFS